MTRPTDGRARAVALRYRPEQGGAPQVVAKGEGELAARIEALAREHGVPVEEDAGLAELLGSCPLGGEIPLELYQAVAELLAFLAACDASLTDSAS